MVVTGNPLGSDRLAQPALVLTGEALAQRRGGTLGDTLDGLPGVAATGFGPQASRPVIRGLDGDRIRLLDNGGARRPMPPTSASTMPWRWTRWWSSASRCCAARPP